MLSRAAGTRPAIYFAEREADVPPLDRAGPAARRDHARRAAARARLPHARPRQVAPRRGAGDAARGAGLRRVPRLPARRLAVPRAWTTRASSNSRQDVRPDRPFLWANLPFAVRKDGGAALRAERLHDRLPRGRGGRRRSRPTATARSSSTSRSTRRTRRCRRCAPTTTRCRRSRTTRCASTPR